MYIALYIGGANIILALLFWAINLSSTSIGQYLTYFILLFGIIIGTVAFRNNQLGGSITYGKAFTSGLLISVFTSIILGFFAFVLFKFIDPAILEEVKELGVNKMLESNPNLTEEQIDMASSFYTPGWMTFFSIVGNILVGLLLSLIAAVFLKKTDNSFDNKFKDVQ